MTKAERDHISRAVALGCALCRALGYGETPAEYHHRRTGTGAGKRASHFDGFPLCPHHHRLGNDALHVMGRKAWERAFNVTEQFFVDQTKELTK
jgi:hypothetical protein